MSGLVRVELTRLRWRRAVVLLTLLPITFAALLLVVRAYETRPLGASDIAEAERMAEEQRQYAAEDLARCKEQPDFYGIPEGGDTDALCEESFSYEPRVEDFLFRTPLSITEERRETGLAVVAVLAVAALLIGTTYVGHDWNTGSMSNQLLFEPRRSRVWATKAAAVALWSVALSAVTLLAFWAVLLVLARSRDIAVSDGVAVDLVQQGLRGTALVTGAAVAGYALTTLTRSTVFTVAALAVFGVAGGLFFGLLGSSALRWEPATNASAVVNGVAEYYVPVPESCFFGTTPPGSGEGEQCDDTREVRAGPAAGYLGSVLVVLAAASAASYRRRDVP
ncbi:ABC transporter permease subunit [Nocardioides litoris]|uniref:ABC transporter permease subunit n=1 Tax=Nocardioides litoris TaxID=1926648 RepID=UPI0014774B2E|nr:ABC transporter permease subunit [Nocardioides litoris]